MNYLVIDLEMCKVPRDYRSKRYKYVMKRYKLVRCFWTRSSRELEHSVSSYTQNMV